MSASNFLLRDAIETLLRLRKPNQVVITTMSAAREWPKLAKNPGEFHYIPSTMSGGPPLGLGIALAQPHREVLVLTGDGSLLMSLGSLVTIVASGATNLTLIVVDNGVYEVTGGQATAGSIAGVDFPGLARAAGFPNVSSFRDLGTWNARASEILAAAGPRCIHLAVVPERVDYLLDPPCSMAEQLAGLKEHLAK